MINKILGWKEDLEALRAGYKGPERLLEPGFGPQALLKFKNGSISRDLDVVEVPQAQEDVRRTPHSILLACWTSMTSVAIRTTSYWTRPCKCDSFLYKKKNIFPRLLVIRWEFVSWGNTFQVLKIPITWGNWFSFRSLRRILQADEIDNRPYVILF